VPISLLALDGKYQCQKFIKLC